MSKNTTKEKRELEVFRRFFDKTKPKIIEESIVNCQPPEPDICCEIDGEGKVWFELAEACSEDFARASSRFPENGVWVGFIGNSTEETVARKVSNIYQADGPIELLVYDDGKHFRPANYTIETIAHVTSSGTGVFRRIWYLSEKSLYQIHPKSY